MRPVIGRLAAVTAAVATLGAATGIPAARGEQSVEELRQRGGAIAAQARSAELELYAIQSRLDATSARLASLEARSASVTELRERVQTQLAAARQTLRAAEAFLGQRLRLLYEEGQADPIEVLLGATSLQEALSDLDGLEFAAQQDREVIAQALEARNRLARLGRKLDAERARLARLRDAARAEAARLDAARAQRQGFLAELLAERSVTIRRIHELEVRVEAARARTARIADVSAPAILAAPTAQPVSAQPQAPPAGGRVLTVTATGYALPGRTATGLPVGWGVVAVDPSVIPLGTRMTIPGYGEGIAADVGSAVKGAKIDLWFPSVEQALAWGVRTVTITLH